MQEVCNLILLQSKFSAYIRQMLLVLKFIIHSFQKELHRARLSISTRQKTGNSIIYQGQPPQSRIIRPVQISKFPFAQFIRYIGICYFFDRPIVVKNKYRYILMLKFFRLYLFLLIPKMINRILFKFVLLTLRQFCKVHFRRLLLS